MRITMLFALFLMSVATFAADGRAKGDTIPNFFVLTIGNETVQTMLAKGHTIPNFFVLAMDNETMLDKDGLREEAKKQGAKRVVLSFFATWCVKCKAEFVLLKKNENKLKENGVLVHLVDVGEKIMKDGQKVSDFVKEQLGDSFPFWFDQNANLLKNFGIVKRNATEFPLPVIVVMDADLRVLNVISEAGKDFPQILWNN